MTDSDDVEDAPKLSCTCMLLARGNSGGMEREPANDGFGEEDVVDDIWLPKAFTPDESISFLVA